MAYRSELETRVAKKTTKAITDHLLIEDGDRVMVGLSGGKDSWALMEILHVLRERAPIDFSIVAVNVDSGYKNFKHDTIARTCEARGWEYRIEHTSIGDVMDDLLEANATPCSLCARLRRGVLYRIAGELGATKIALGHHADDFVETLLLNLFFAGSLKAMPARLVSDNGKHVVIRPLAYVSEDDARDYTLEVGLPIIGCCCPACGDLGLQRQRVKSLLLDLEREHPGVKSSMLKALGNVMPRHLLDVRLNPPAALRSGRARRRRSHCHHRLMRAVLQRVSSARVRVDGAVVGEIARGFLVLLGVGRGDGDAEVEYIAGKIHSVRVFPDDEGRMNRSIADVGGAVLVVSQFTLYGDVRRGRRPSFIDAARTSSRQRALRGGRRRICAGAVSPSRPASSRPTCRSSSSTTGRSR